MTIATYITIYAASAMACLIIFHLAYTGGLKRNAPELKYLTPEVQKVLTIASLTPGLNTVLAVYIYGRSLYVYLKGKFIK